jgi:hypothetical protein
MNEHNDYKNVLGLKLQQSSDLNETKANKFTERETEKLNFWVDWLDKIWTSYEDDRLISSFGETDEGDSWITVTQTGADADTTLCALWLEIIDGQRVWNYRCEPRQRYFRSLGTLDDLMIEQMPDGLFETLKWGTGETNVVQFI